jgi:UDP:flavonoid glycosyltransferase YjiC (YdhE family)
MRILLTWELGLNRGHLTRLLPVAQELKRQGHTVLIAARDLEAASVVLGAANIPFIQAPHLPKGIPLAHRASGYADILLSQGWSDTLTLWALTHAWLTIFRLFRPDKLILDYSPTVSLAAMIAEIPTVVVGNGFELPPLTDPLPPFPGFSWATPDKAAHSEAIAIGNANRVLKAFKRAPITAIRDLAMGQIRLFATFPELDHYGERQDAQYIGPLQGQLKAQRIDWPEGEGRKILASLRTDTSYVKDILSAFAVMPLRVICIAGGFTSAQLAPYFGSHIRYSLVPVELDPLLNADLCVTYGAEGTMLRFLSAGVPLLTAPWHVEAFMAAHRISAGGLGQTLDAKELNDTGVTPLIDRLTKNATTRARVRAFADRVAGHNDPLSHILSAVHSWPSERLLHSAAVVQVNAKAAT